MDDKNNAIRELHEKIEALARQHKEFQAEIHKLQNAVFELDLGERPVRKTEAPPLVAPGIPVTPPMAQEKKQAPQTVPGSSGEKEFILEGLLRTRQARDKDKNEKTALEEFIGTNLLNKVGIAILVIGIGFGAKYSIEHQLIDPLTRIILGYLAGMALIGIAIRLKKDHANFSAVLLSGGMAVLYFITYAAYDFYALIPQELAFALMVLFTAFTVFAAIQYDLEVIGIIGLVGAYAVPFLLSDGSGRVVILFSYIAIINAGILLLAFKRSWKRLYYLAFALTWASFIAWFITDYREHQYLGISLGFSTLFFLTFYATFLSYKLIRKEPFSRIDLVVMLLNSFLYYGFGYLAIDSGNENEQYLGLFTLSTAVLHFIACVIIYRTHRHFKDIFYFVAGMVLVFLTLAVPVQLEGYWVTVIWAFEAALLYWIGRAKGFAAYETLSYPLMLLAAGSLVHDWTHSYVAINLITYLDPANYPLPTLFFNVQFLTTVLVVGALSTVLWISSRKEFPSPFHKNPALLSLTQNGLPLLILILLYAGIYLEIDTFWNLSYLHSKVLAQPSTDPYDVRYDNDLLHFKTLWLISYSAIFALALSFLQLRLKIRNLLYLSLAVNVIVIFVFLTDGLLASSYLRDSYLNGTDSAYYYRDIGHLLIRYVALALIVPLMIMNYRHVRHSGFQQSLHQTERILFHAAVLVLLSSELVNILDLMRVENSFKLALSILWGAYALFLIVFGLWKNQGYIRIAAIVLFGVTLAKLFLYDIADMSTIAKTVVMIILGVLMLVASFLYNKYKRVPEK